jgi:hypothetical protein
MRLPKNHSTVVAKLPAGPYTPAQAYNLVAAFGTEIRTVTREERQSFRIIDDTGLSNRFALTRVRNQHV